MCASDELRPAVDDLDVFESKAIEGVTDPEYSSPVHCDVVVGEIAPDDSMSYAVVG